MTEKHLGFSSRVQEHPVNDDYDTVKLRIKLNARMNRY